MKLNGEQRKQLNRLSKLAQAWANVANPYQNSAKIDAVISTATNAEIQAIEDGLPKRLDDAKDNVENQRICNQQHVLSSFNYEKRLEELLTRKIDGFDKWKNDTTKLLLALGEKEIANTLKNTPSKPRLIRAGDCDNDKLHSLIRKQSKVHHESWEKYLLLAQSNLSLIAKRPNNNAYLFKHAKKIFVGAIVVFIFASIVSALKSCSPKSTEDTTLKADLIKK